MSATGRSLAELASKGPISPKKLSHVVLRTADTNALRDWYKSVLGARIAFEGEGVCFLTYDEEHHRIGIIRPPDLSSAVKDAGPGLEHLSFTFGELGELLATYRRLKAQGIEPYWTINHGPTISFYYHDPDKNRIELQIDVFDTAAQADEFIHDYYPENFIGIIIDPEELARKYEQGAPLEELVRRPKLPPGMTPWDMVRM